MLGFNSKPAAVEPAVDDLDLKSAEVEEVKVEDVLPGIGAVPDTGAPDYHAFMVPVALNGEPVQLLGFDLTRVAARIQASEEGVYVGKYDVLGGISRDIPNGFPIPKSGTVDLKSTEAYYVRYIGTANTTAQAAYVAVMVEVVGATY